MKTVYKIFILLIVFIGLVAAVSVFYNTRVTMPETAGEMKAHLHQLRRNTFAIVGTDNEDLEGKLNPDSFLNGAELEEVYQRQLLSLIRFYEEGFITAQEYNEQLDTFVSVYSEVFLYGAKNIFKERIWSDANRDFLKNRVLSLRNVCDYNNIRVLSAHDSLDSKIAGVFLSCQDYEVAIPLLYQSHYDDFYAVSTRVEKIKSLIDNGNLDDNTELLRELKAYPSLLGDGHLESIKSLSSKIADWQYYSLQATIANFNEFESEAEKYTSSGEIYGGSHPNDISDIVSSAKANKKAAVDELSTLTVDESNSAEVTYYLDNSSGSIVLNVNTNHPDGYNLAATSSDWFSISSRDDYYVTISYGANNSSSIREDYFYVKSGNKSVQVKLKQEPKKYSTYNSRYLSANSTFTWDSSPGANMLMKVEVTSNSDCDLDVYIYNSNGTLITSDTRASKSATVNFTTPYSGKYSIKIKNCSSSGCYYELREQQQ